VGWQLIYMPIRGGGAQVRFKTSGREVMHTHINVTTRLVHWRGSYRCGMKCSEVRVDLFSSDTYTCMGGGVGAQRPEGGEMVHRRIHKRQRTLGAIEEVLSLWDEVFGSLDRPTLPDTYTYRGGVAA